MATKATPKQASEFVCITPIGTVAFPHVWKPHTFKNNRNPGAAPKEPQFRLMLVFDKNADLDKLKKTAGRALMKKFGGETKSLMKRGKLSVPFRKNEEYDEYGEPWDTLEGGTFISANSNSAPGIVDERAEPIIQQQDFYPGCKARISVYAHAYDSMGNKGVTFLLNNIQKTGDGKRLSGRKDASDEFEAIDSADSTDVEDLF